MTTTLRTGLTAVSLLSLAALTVAPTAAAAPTASAEAGHYWTCNYGLDPANPGDPTTEKVTLAAGEKAPQVGDTAARTKDTLKVVASLDAEPAGTDCYELMAKYAVGYYDASRTVVVWSCLYTIQDDVPVFVEDEGNELLQNPTPVYLTPKDAKEVPVGTSVHAEDLLTFVVKHTARDAKAPTKADCAAMLPEIADENGIELPGGDQPNKDADQPGKPAKPRPDTTKPTPDNTKPAKPGRGVPAHTGVGM